MSDKKVTIEINGKEAVCDFGVNWYYKFYYEATGKDLLVTGLQSLASSEMFDMLPALFFAAYKAECKMTKKDPELELKDFEELLLSSDEAFAGKMLNDFLTARGVTGEPEAQT